MACPAGVAREPALQVSEQVHHLVSRTSRHPSPCCRSWCPRARWPARIESVVSTPNTMGTPFPGPTWATPLEDLRRGRSRSGGVARGSPSQADDGVVLARLGDLLGHQRDLEGPGHLKDPGCPAPGRPPGSARQGALDELALMKSLNRLATRANFIPWANDFPLRDVLHAVFPLLSA